MAVAPFPCTAMPPRRRLMYTWLSSSPRIALPSSVVIRRHLRHEKRELLGHVHPNKELLRHVGVAVRIGEDHLNQLSHAAEHRSPHLDGRQGTVATVSVSGGGVDRGIANDTVVERPMFVGRARIVRHLEDPLEELPGHRLKLLCRYLLRPRDRLDERVTIERIELVKDHDRDHESIAHLGWRDGATHADDHVHVQGTRRRAHCFYE